MDLKSFDNKCVRITTKSGEVYEGDVSYCGKEYMSHEYGYNQEALLLVPILFFKDDLLSIESLEDVNGQFGHFSEKYGLLEEKCLWWGTDYIEEVFDADDDIRILRMLACMNDNFQTLADRTVSGMAPRRSGGSIPESEDDDNDTGPIYLGDLEKLLETLIKYNDSDEVVKEAKSLLEQVTAYFY